MIVYSDLDGCFLDRDTYSYDKTIEYAQKIIDSDNMLIFCSSKTYEEIFDIMNNIDRQMPFIVENGGGIYIPNKYNYLKSEKYSIKNNGRLINLTNNNIDIYNAIINIRNETGIEMLTYQDLTISAICSITGLNKYQAAFAKNRNFSETIITPLNNRDIKVLESRLNQLNLTCTNGSRYYTVHPNDINKGKAALMLFECIKNMKIVNDITIGIGDSSNDESLLSITDMSYLLKNKDNQWQDIKGNNIIKIDGLGQVGWIKVYKEISKKFCEI